MSDSIAELVVTGITKSFASGDRPIDVLRGADLRVGRGESTSIRGHSGCGKTTLLNIIAGLEAADGGRVFWDGDDIALWSAGERALRRARWIGMVFQAYYLIPEMNAMENVLFPARILGKIHTSDQVRAEALMRRVGLGDRLPSSPMHLSGGERQRVALARALINRPRFILADEPTGNLDETTAREVMDLLFEVCAEEGSSLILVTHNPGFADRTDLRLQLRDGVLNPV